MVQLARKDFGDIDNTYRGDIWAVTLKPAPQLLGRVNRAHSEIWAIISSTLLKCLREAGHGGAFK